MSRYIMRLDDACEKRDVQKWDYAEKLLVKYGIKPLVGVIPHCEDPMMNDYPEDGQFWERVKQWKSNGWTIALHGFNHVYGTTEGGINPVNMRSEFAGESLDLQKEKIRKGIAVFREHGIEPEVFFAPSHTFDENTIEALKTESNIFIISDTIANKPYTKYGMTFVPQQSGTVRKLPLHTVTFCYHPNVMNDADYQRLEEFIKANLKSFCAFPLEKCNRKPDIFDSVLRFAYFCRR